MGSRGPIGKTPRLRTLEGNPGKRQLRAAIPIEDGPPAAVPNPPPFLGGKALAEWYRVAPDLHRQGWLREAETHALAIYCASFAGWEAAEARYAAALADPQAKPLGLRTLQAITAKAADLTIRTGALFGLSPASRARLPGAEPLVPKDPARVLRADPAREFFPE
jgi:P27 family predicted phage terminase small subunit